MAKQRLGIELSALEAFVAVVEAGGMTAAARRLGQTQSAVSQTIIALEKTLGVALLDRSVRPPAPTAAGAVLQARAGPLLAEARALAAGVRDAAGTALPRLRLALVDSLAATVGPHLVRALRDAASRWSLWSGLSEAHADALRAREVDVILADDTVADGDGLLRRAVLREPYVLAVPADWKDAAARSLAELAAARDMVRYSARQITGRQIERHLHRVGVAAPRRLEFDASDAVLAMVSAGVGWAITTPLCALQARAALDGLRLLPLPGPGFERRLSLFARRDELGDLPQRIAATTATILHRESLPALTATAAWLPQRIHVGDAAE